MSRFAHVYPAGGYGYKSPNKPIKWAVRVSRNSKYIHLGTFESEEEAGALAAECRNLSGALTNLESNRKLY